MQLELPFLRSEPAGPPVAFVPEAVPAGPPPDPRIEFVRMRRARKYILRVRPDGTLRVTIPRGGSRRDAEAFVAKHQGWAEQERRRVAAQYAPVEWREGHAILLRGVPAPLRLEAAARGLILVLDGEAVRVNPGAGDLRPAAETVLKRIATRDLLPRLHELALEHGLTVTRAVIRNQRSRWGSCSRTGIIALNFRLVQMPPSVCEYVLLHELMHLRQQNHSRRYWRLVEDVCPGFRDAERWLRVEGRALF